MVRFLCFLALLSFPFSPGRAAPEHPNFVFFLVDDMGWADVGCNGSTFYETPNIDALADSGVRFTQGYAAASICSPTRASILTGRHPVRVNITDWIPGSKAPDSARFLYLEDRDNLALEETTIAESLKQHGYGTFFAGKWHLGDEGHWPTDQGFDVNIGGHDRGSPPGGYYGPWNNPVLKAKHKGEYLTERLTEESIDYMRNRDTDRPFFLYLSYYNIHTPIQPYEKHIEHFEEKAKTLSADPVEAIAERDGFTRARQDNPDLASMVSAVDESVGAILRALDELAIAEDTVVIFFSDNGGLSTKPQPGPGCNLPLRAGKGWLYEGGIREPMIVRAPGVSEGGRVCDVPVMSTDFYPTILDLAGLPAEPERHSDGVSLKPLLEDSASVNVGRPLFWHYPHYHGSTWKPGGAVRDGDWKLIEFWEEDTVELYNLTEDPGEQQDLAKAEPERVQQLQAMLEQWRQEIGARMPEPNPDFAARQ